MGIMTGNPADATPIQTGGPGSAPVGSDQFNVANAIATLFKSGTLPATAAAPAPVSNNTYDKWGHIVSGNANATTPAATPAAAAPAAPAAAALAAAAAPAGAYGTSGYDMWGRQAPPAAAAPMAAQQQLPAGLGDLAALIAEHQAKQQQLQLAGLLGRQSQEGGGAEGGGEAE